MRRYLWCFPGLGKSSLRVSGLTVVDADCEQFKFRDVNAVVLHGNQSDKSFERDESYPENYLSYIRRVEADMVLLNCHISLLEQLDKGDILLVYPDVSLIPEYLQRYQDRGDLPSFTFYMADEAKGMLQYIEESDFDKYRVMEPCTYLSDLFERNDFKVKVMTRVQLAEHLQKAMDLGVIRDELHTDGPSKLVCDVKFAHEKVEHPLKNGAAWAEAVLDGRYELDVEQLIYAVLEREGELKREHEKLISHFKRAIDLNVLDTDKAHYAIICDLSFANDGTVSADVHDAYDLAEAVMNGKYDVDIDNLLDVCKKRELQIEEMRFADLRGGLSREELADKLMQGIVNGALGIRYGEIAPYSHGYAVTFSGNATAGSTREFKNRWECYCDFFDIPARIVAMIEAGRQSSQVFGKNAEPLNIRELLQAIDEMEANKITSFTPEKETNFERWGSRGYGSRGSIACVKDVHAGKGLDGIVQHHYHGDYSSMTPSRQNDLVETLVFMKGFCLDCLDGLDIGPAGRQKVVEYLKKHGTDISTPEKLREWTRDNSQKCGYEKNRQMGRILENDKQLFAHAYKDYFKLKILAESFRGSFDDLYASLKGFNKDFDYFDVNFGVITATVNEKVLASQYVFSVSTSIDIWDDSKTKLFAENIPLSKLHDICVDFGFDVKQLEAVAQAEVSEEKPGLDEQIAKSVALKGEQDLGIQDVDKER